MNCAAVRPLIESLLDDELDASQQAQVSEHVQQCANCGAEYSKLLRLRQELRSPALRFRASDSLRQSIATSIRKPAAMPPSRPALQWLAIAASVALVVSLGMNIYLAQGHRSRRQIMAQEVLSGHARAMLGTHLVDIVSSERHTVKPWFGDKLDFSPNVKDLASNGFPLAGARVDYLDGRPVAALVFRRAQHVVELFTWPSNETAASEVSQNGYHVVAWNKDGMAFWAVSDISLDDLKKFSNLYRQD